MFPRGTAEEVELFGRISLFLGNAPNIQPEDKAASTRAGGYFFNFMVIPPLVSLAGSMYFLKNSKIGTAGKIFCYSLSACLGGCLGLRLASFSEPSSYYMDLNTPLGEYAREQAKLILPPTHPIIEQIEKRESENEGRDIEIESGRWERELYIKQRYDKLSSIVSISPEEQAKLQEIRETRMARYFNPKALNSPISCEAYRKLHSPK